ncbi:MAG: PKD domain-containing protein [Saprospiraceae bacterium]|nr:PKD domain-containing protein [Saprospiraceae bacterium]
MTGKIEPKTSYRLSPLDGSPADTLGLDNHPVAKFRFEADTTNHLRVRFTDLSYFRPESWRWRFGDGKSWNGKRPLWHTFPENGSYKVCLTVCNENSCDTLCRWLTLGPDAIPEAEISPARTTVHHKPTDGPLLVTLQDYIPEHAIIYLYDIMIKQVFHQRVFNDWNSLDLTLLPAGTYFYIVKDRDRVFGRGKVVRM